MVEVVEEICERVDVATGASGAPVSAQVEGVDRGPAIRLAGKYAIATTQLPVEPDRSYRLTFAYKVLSEGTWSRTTGWTTRSP